MRTPLSLGSAANGMIDVGVREFPRSGFLLERIHQNIEHIHIRSPILFTHRLEPPDCTQRPLDADLSISHWLAAWPAIRSIAFLIHRGGLFAPVGRRRGWFKFLETIKIERFRHREFLPVSQPPHLRRLERSRSPYRSRRPPLGPAAVGRLLHCEELTSSPA